MCITVVCVPHVGHAPVSHMCGVPQRRAATIPTAAPTAATTTAGAQPILLHIPDFPARPLPRFNCGPPSACPSSGQAGHGQAPTGPLARHLAVDAASRRSKASTLASASESTLASAEHVLATCCGLAGQREMGPVGRVAAEVDHCRVYMRVAPGQGESAVPGWAWRVPGMHVYHLFAHPHNLHSQPY